MLVTPGVQVRVVATTQAKALVVFENASHTTDGRCRRGLGELQLGDKGEMTTQTASAARDEQ